LNSAFELFVKFEKINSLNVPINIPLIIDKCCFDIPQYNELIAFFNKDKRKLILIKESCSICINKLYYISTPNIIPPNYKRVIDIKPEDVLFDIKTLEYLRLNLLKYSSNKDFPKRIYLSRKKDSDRRKFNEDQVFGLLEKYGFKTIFPEDYSIADQVALFNNADFIAGGSGAALTNLLYCKPTCKVIVFSKNNLPFSYFSTIASFVGINMIYLTENEGNISEMKHIHEPFNIDLDKLNDVIIKLL
jgi:hypothetical protein